MNWIKYGLVRVLDNITGEIYLKQTLGTIKKRYDLPWLCFN